MNNSIHEDDEVLERVVDYWNARPCNIRHSTAPIGTREYFDQVEARKYFVEPHIPRFAEFECWKGKRVLEVGCGIGTDAVNFSRAGAIYTGVDISSESLKLARKRFDVFNLDGRFVEANAECLETHFEEDEFDLVYSFGVLHHTPSPPRAIQSIRKVINRRGSFKLMLYAKNSWKASMIAAGLDQPEAQFGCPIAFTYNREELSSLLEPDFHISNARQDHIFPFKVDEYVNYNYVREDWFEAMPSIVFKALEEQLGWHYLIDATPS
ncbi:class I SAM-dependent methyltransferase [Polycladidibacter hongkongensis]|uniref:class I SAM-dependent methyltransferase n=1 Tax=Polycladidibacter hongkongensis TaxID=1647556 RepID=UPI0009EB3604|nr:class I SAM-dependent methyltransferase [Pseudovibrio hongkongensis]